MTLRDRRPTYWFVLAPAVIAVLAVALLTWNASPGRSQGTAPLLDAPVIYDENDVSSGPLPFEVLLTRTVSTNVGDLLFGVLYYTSPWGDYCWDDAVANREYLIAFNSGGFCSDGPLTPDEDVRYSWGTQIIRVARPAGQVTELPYVTVSGPVSPDVEALIVTLKTSTDNIYRLSTEAQNGGFLAVSSISLRDAEAASSVSVAAFDEDGNLLDRLKSTLDGARM